MPSDSAFVKVVDRLLASKAYGEKWGRKWLDLARYADTAGESADYPIPQHWHLIFRDHAPVQTNFDQAAWALPRSAV